LQAFATRLIVAHRTAPRKCPRPILLKLMQWCKLSSLLIVRACCRGGVITRLQHFLK
jgi:hypothetical protein